MIRLATNVNNILHGPCTLAVDGVDVGYTTDGVTLRKSRDFVDVEADQTFGIIAKKVAMEKMFVSTTMLEITLANIVTAMSEPASNTSGSGDLEYGDDAPEATETVLTITGKAPSDATRTYTFYRAVSSEDIDEAIGVRDAVSSLPVTWELLKDADHDNKFGYHTDA